jgi:ATP-dependent helicase/nuclease subunit B
MATIEREHLLETPSGRPQVAARWDALARRVTEWAAAQRVAPGDAVVLLPFAQLLAPARAAFGRAGAWLPRIETTQTLARSLGPPPRAAASQLCLDASADLLTAARLLEGQAWGREWSRRDPRGLAHAVAAVVDTAQALWRAAAAVAPARREAFWSEARAELAPLAGPGATERLLARVALEWAAFGVEPATDRLFELQPGAWIVLQAGGPDALATALLDAAPDAVPCLWLLSDPEGTQLWPEPAGFAAPALAVCDGFEHEAQCAAAQVIAHLQRGEQPVALVAQDRVLVRRVRALLDAAGATLVDETGWTLSTTRAAARVMALLRVAADGAGTDQLFDWLKGVQAWPGWRDAPARVAALEAECRRRQVARVAALAALPLDGALAAFRDAALALLRRLAAQGRLEAGEWLTRLADALAACGALATLQADEAGRQVLAALRLDVPADVRLAWLEPVGASALDAAGFAAWVDAVFERAIYRPGERHAVAAQVIVAPLAQAIWRPFAAIVLPGADDAQFGTLPAPHPLLGEAELRALGLLGAEQRRAVEALTFAQALQTAPVTLLRRRHDAGEPRGDSVLVERLRLELQRRGGDLGAWQDPRLDLRPLPAPFERPAPAAAALLQPLLSASAAEALRACPYRFYALHLLGLAEANELDAEVEKRDYGNWLHEVLQRFHAERGVPGPREAEMRRLAELGRELQAQQGLDDAEFVPFAASFEVFVPRYVDWLHARDAAGARWREAETEFVQPLAGVDGIALRGRIDRIDAVRGPAGPMLELIDYKTGSVQPLKDKVKESECFEDTQLAFYAALVMPEGVPLRATYLALDNTKGITPIEHRQVERSAAALVQGLGADLRRLQAGAGLPALGEGATCDYCDARGLCRRDHWRREVAP